MKIEKKNKMIKINEYWFDCSLKKLPYLSFSVTRALLKKDRLSLLKEKKITLISHINKATPDDILKLMRKKLRYDIKAFEKKINESNEITIEKISKEEFIRHYNSFSKTKNLSPISKKINDNNLIFIGLKINNALVCSHGYIHNHTNTVRLLYSALHNEHEKNISNTDTQNTNKYLHYHDLQYFSNNGFKVYDWGGVSDNDEKRKGIDNFKSGFGGTECIYYDYYSFGYYILKMLRKIKKDFIKWI